MTELTARYNVDFEQRALHFSYEKAGQVIHRQPIPWNAECVVVEGLLNLRTSQTRSIEDYRLVMPNQTSCPAERLHPDNGDPTSQRYRILFRLPPITESMRVELQWRDRILSGTDLTLPFLSRTAFVNQLTLDLPTVSVRLGDEHLSCEKFVANQCRGLLASALLTSPTSLLPLLDLPLTVSFYDDQNKVTETAPVRFSSSQITERRALLSVVPKSRPKRLGDWIVTWKTGKHVLGTKTASGISVSKFERSLRVSDVRYVVRDSSGKFSVTRQLPEDRTGAGIGPCFLLCSRKSGMAGHCRLQIRAQLLDAQGDFPLFEQHVVVSDGVTVVAPGTLDASELENVQGFKLMLKGRNLAALPLHSAPSARFDAEGGFKQAPDLLWSTISDQELNERLSRLLEE